MSLDLNSKPSRDLEGAARESEKLQIAERMPQPRRLEMPQMSDVEIYLRLNVPNGLMNNQQQPQKYITEDIEAPNGIRQDRN